MESTSANEGIQNLSVDRAKEWLARNKESAFILLDVRQPEEYKSSHLPGAVLMPLPSLMDKIGELDPAKSLLVYCRSGNRSRAAAAFLLSKGFSKVYSIDGGITAWNGRAATGSYDEGLFLLKGRKTVEELVSLALAFEEGSRMFYTSVAELPVDAEAKNILNTIAEAEVKHKINILEAYKLITGEDFADDILNREPLKRVMESGVRIEDAISFLKEQGKTVLDILEVSMQLETNAIDLYMKILRKIEDVNAKKVFDIIVEEEQHHLSELGQLLGGRVT
jgi:sulfur-carrier protein adenylyltransferase/sulfurtransferase